jgi:hypothetical protein
MADAYYAVNRASVDENTIEHKVGPFRARVKSGASIVLFTLSGEGAFFTGTSVASAVDERVEDERLVQTITIDPTEEFSEPRKLSAMGGSLQKVYRFLEPERHFKFRDIIRLSEQDYMTISDNLIAVHRSVFRFLFSSLPLDVQSDFVRRFISDLPLDDDGNIKSYESLAPLIVDYYRWHIRSPLVLIERFAAVHQNFGSERARVAPQRRTPNLRSLVLRNGEVGEDIQFGETSEGVSRLMANNRLFAKGPEDPPLLDEAATQLREAGAEEHLWSDPIF